MEALTVLGHIPTWQQPAAPFKPGVHAPGFPLPLHICYLSGPWKHLSQYFFLKPLGKKGMKSLALAHSGCSANICEMNESLFACQVLRA